MEQTWYSLRMRASDAGRHLSGAERIGRVDDLSSVTAGMVERALACGASAEQIVCTVERIDGAVVHAGALPNLKTWDVPDADTGRCLARTLLARSGVAPAAVDKALQWLAEGPAPGGQVMRGAMLVDARSGRRLESDPARGVRVSRMDVHPGARTAVLSALAAHGLSHHRTAEALVLAGKVLTAPGVLAELCWSDAPDYLAGYVADPTHGYQRITHLKAPGDPRGGRALFVDPDRVALVTLVTYLEQQAVLFDRVGTFHPVETWRPEP